VSLPAQCARPRLTQRVCGDRSNRCNRQLSCSPRTCSPPSSSAKYWTADGLKNRTASAAPRRSAQVSFINCGWPQRAVAITSVTCAPWLFKAGGKSGFARSLRGKNTFAPQSRFPNSSASAAPVCVSATYSTGSPLAEQLRGYGPTEAIRSLFPARIKLRFSCSLRLTTARTACALVRMIQSIAGFPQSLRQAAQSLLGREGHQRKHHGNRSACGQFPRQRLTLRRGTRNDDALPGQGTWRCFSHAAGSLLPESTARPPRSAPAPCALQVAPPDPAERWPAA